MTARWLAKLGRFETADELEARTARTAKTLPRLGYVQCSLCDTRFTDMGDHLIRRMVSSGWLVSTDAPHNLCPEHAVRGVGHAK